MHTCNVSNRVKFIQNKSKNIYGKSFGRNLFRSIEFSRSLACPFQFDVFLKQLNEMLAKSIRTLPKSTPKDFFKIKLTLTSGSFKDVRTFLNTLLL